MITMTKEQLEKIELLDRLFGALDVEQLRQFSESEQIVSILKGTNGNPEILKNLIQEHSVQMMDVMSLKSEVLILKSDFKELIKALNTTLFTAPYNQDFQSLKSRHNIY